MHSSIAVVIATAALMADLRNDSYFRITVVDEATGRGVPLIELRTVNDVRHYTDSSGVVAFHEPGLMDESIFFQVRGHGYELPPDGFGFRGRRYTTTPGGEAIIKVRRINIAERLYRITGAGIYADSLRVGMTPPIQHPLLNARVFGSDSVQAAVFKDRIHWFWGDTNQPSYPLGIFHAPGATSKLPSAGGLDPSAGVELEYFSDANGFAKPTCKMPGDGPTWIDGLAVVADSNGTQRLFAHYLKVKPPLTIYQQGLAEFNAANQEFEPRVVFPESAVVIPSGHSFVHTDNGTRYVYFAKPFPLVRVLASAEAVLDPEQYETFTCLKPGSKADDAELDRDDNGKLKYAWRRGTPLLTAELQKKLVAAGKLKSIECLHHVRDIESNKPVNIHHGSINWNAYRQKWILIAAELYGSSVLGETWYAESDSPVGPWAFARKIITHDKQSFYNPRHHPFFDQQQGKIIYLEGTYTHSFSGNDERTPRYEYNQIMYRLDLSDSRLALPVAVYRQATDGTERLSMDDKSLMDGTFRQVAFYACDRAIDGAVPVFADNSDQGTVLSLDQPAREQDKPLFYALPTDVKSIPPSCAPLFELTNDQGHRKYATGEQSISGYRRGAKPLCYVWTVPE